MKIIKLTIKNYERIKCVEIAPNGAPVVTIGGKNKQGKTSALDAIAAGLRGAVGRSARPVREGADRADILCEFDGLTIHSVTEADGGTVLEVKDAKGKVKAPQKFLDELVGRSKLFSDPLLFMRMEPREQLELLRKIVGLDLTDLEAKRAGLVEDRDQCGRDVKGRKLAIEAMPEYADAPAEEIAPKIVQAQTAQAELIDLAPLYAELEAARAHNRDVDAKAAAILAKQGEQVNAYAAIAQAEQEIAKWQKVLTARKALAEGLYETVGKMMAEFAQTARADEAPINARIAEAQTANGDAAAKAGTANAAARNAATIANQKAVADAAYVNAKVRANKARREAVANLQEWNGQYKALTEQIDVVDREKGQRLAGATFPVAGLGFGLQGVLLNSLPFEQASGAEQLQVSTAIALSLLPANGIRLLLVRDASLLDPDMLKVMSDMAGGNDIQLWLELVTEDPNRADVILEDGLVKGAAT